MGYIFYYFFLGILVIMNFYIITIISYSKIKENKRNPDVPMLLNE